MLACKKIARILRADKDTVQNVCLTLEKITGKKEVLDSIYGENILTIGNRLKTVGLSFNSSAKQIFDVLTAKLNRDNQLLKDLMGGPDLAHEEGYQTVASFVSSIPENKRGFFIKKEKFVEFLEKTPPQKIIDMFGYKSVGELLEKEDWREIAAALRFVQGEGWINSVFLESYKSLSPSDFEQRDIEIIALNSKWYQLGEKFIEKKYHNISHLKELGIIFIIPLSLDVPGELMRNVGLLFHYVNEVRFYSKIFERISKDNQKFYTEFSSLLRGDVPDNQELSLSGDWLIVQRYLAKDDENDWRLFSPHVNPEAIHWEKAEKMIVDLGKKYNSVADDFAFWSGLNWVGDYFPTDTGIEVLVSFNLIDTSMSLIKKQEMIKYLYHHQESLWNKIFSSYFGEEKMEEMIRENIVEGYISFDNK
ncbi:MAG: hypothetical protein UV58_C0008G0002 [Candidatus Wolfebacteria bacterium GW2011_GWC1_43_10]|uniref:Glycosidase related protein n=2 Tax=Candidatus Wolfeibacteriota TaxID=1752735 RepID=A0A0G1CAE6_9BACT|nr:MAG: hypothetical protein UV58_C0008G0002 [Candidatus Wolfebacteria bacterium GW2011_GWC1_43_10]KKT22632.1 MAG: hypothetical protein UW08_C0005G0007 [Parcubacteria group bacterium GW2011_GWB1_43_8b]OGM89635.1 MAG: hypothetical protein A2108_01540 [Candidatus Wolfebacteria bacterium GWA1_42_9]